MNSVLATGRVIQVNSVGEGILMMVLVGVIIAVASAVWSKITKK